MKVLILLLFSIACWGQSTVPDPLPKWFGLGGGPGLGWAAYATPLNSNVVLGKVLPNTLPVYSFSLYEVTIVNGKPVTSTTSGADTEIRSLDAFGWTFSVHGIGTAGVATTPTATTGSFSGGGMVMGKKGHWTFEATYLREKSGSPVTHQWLFGFGRTF